MQRAKRDPSEVLEPTRLREVPLLSQLPGPVLARIVANCTVQSLNKDELLCRRGARADFLHIVSAGRVGLFSEGPQADKVVDFLGPGEALLVPAVVLDVPCVLSARMLEKGDVILWPAAAFRRELKA